MHPGSAVVVNTKHILAQNSGLPLLRCESLRMFYFHVCLHVCVCLYVCMFMFNRVVYATRVCVCVCVWVCVLCRTYHRCEKIANAFMLSVRLSRVQRPRCISDVLLVWLYYYEYYHIHDYRTLRERIWYSTAENAIWIHLIYIIYEFVTAMNVQHFHTHSLAKQQSTIESVANLLIVCL